MKLFGKQKRPVSSQSGEGNFNERVLRLSGKQQQDAGRQPAAEYSTRHANDQCLCNTAHTQGASCCSDNNDPKSNCSRPVIEETFRFNQ